MCWWWFFLGKDHRLINMFPTFFQNYLRDTGLAKSVLSAKHGLVNSALLVSLANLSYQTLSHYCHAVVFPTQGAAFGYTVRRIFLVGSKKQMVRSYAGRIIAPMKHAKVIRNWTIVQEPRKTMSAAQFVKAAVAVPVNSCRPDPTAVTLFNVKPKSRISRNGAAFSGTEATGMITAPRAKRISASFAKTCYFESSQGANLRNRFVNWLGSFSVVSAVRAVTILA